MTILMKSCRELIVISCPFRLPRSPFSTGDKVIELMLESGNTIEDAGKSVCVIERSVRSYG
jgi:hypothetical protein